MTAIRPSRLTDPEEGISPACACHDRPEPGSAYGWHARTGPLPVLTALHGDRRPSWIDHAYRVRLPDGRWRYVAEPYELTAEAIADLDYLARHGFDVTATAWRARHYPGHTTAVEITAEAMA